MDDLRKLSYEQLIQEVLELRKRVQQLESENHHLIITTANTSPRVKAIGKGSYIPVKEEDRNAGDG